jgi:hypothetical protein
MENNFQKSTGTNSTYNIPVNSVSTIDQGAVKILQQEYNTSYENSGEFDSTKDFSDVGLDINNFFAKYGIKLNNMQSNILMMAWTIGPKILDSIIQSLESIKEQLSHFGPYQSISINPNLDPEISNYFLIEIEIKMKVIAIPELVDLWENLNTKCVKFSHPQIALFVNLKSVG